MVFENVTLFELHLENSRFTASRGDETEEGSEYESYESESEHGSYESEEESGGRRKALPLGLLFVLVIAGVAVRRYRSGDDDGGGVGSVGEPGGVTIEQAAEQ